MGGRRAETGGGPTRQGAVAVSCRDHGGRPRRPGLGAPSAPARRPGGGATPRRARIARGRGMPGRHARGRARQDGGRGAATRPRGWTAGGPASAPDVRPRLGARAAGRVVGGVLPAVRRLARARRVHGPRAHAAAALRPLRHGMGGPGAALRVLLRDRPREPRLPGARGRRADASGRGVPDVQGIPEGAHHGAATRAVGDPPGRSDDGPVGRRRARGFHRPERPGYALEARIAERRRPLLGFAFGVRKGGA